MRVLYGLAISRLCASALVVAVLAGLSACEKNSGPFTASPADSGSGSYAASDKADCLPVITLVDQHGRAVALPSLKGKPVLINFIYANCATACPLLTAKFAAVAKLLGQRLGADVTMVSITIDPEHDHPAELLAYARSHEADYPGWLFLTGKPADIERVLKIFGLRRTRSPDGTISHLASSFMLGPDGRQERIYDALEVPPQTVVSDIGRAQASG